MKKKTYKQMQNRLYREIKHRMIAEGKMKMPVPRFHVIEKTIETVRCVKMINAGVCREEEMELVMENVRKDLVHSMCDKLMEEGYLLFTSQVSSADDVVPMVKTEAIMQVVKPVPSMLYEYGGLK